MSESKSLWLIQLLVFLHTVQVPWNKHKRGRIPESCIFQSFQFILRDFIQPGRRTHVNRTYERVSYLLFGLLQWYQVDPLFQALVFILYWYWVKELRVLIIFLLKQGDKYYSFYSFIIFHTFISFKGSEVFVYLFLIKCLTKMYMVIIYGEFRVHF